MPVPIATENGTNVDLTWPAFHQFDDTGNPHPAIDAQLEGFLVYRSTTNATWNDNPAMGPVSGNLSDWMLVGGTVNSPVAGTSWTDVGILAGSGNTYYYSVKPVIRGVADNVDFKYGGWGSNGIADPMSLPPLFVYANNTGINVRLEWSGGSPPFEIYISNQINGSGFNFAVPDDITSNYWWEHVGVIGDGINYSYIVREQGSSTNSNLAWKFACPVQQPGAPNINWVSLPYVNGYETLVDFGAGIEFDISWEIRLWVAADQEWRAILYSPMIWWLGDTSYPISPGDALAIFANVGPGTWDIVGSHDPNLVLDILQPGLPNINWVSLPYHHSYATLGDIGPSVGNNISWEIRCWCTAEQQYKVILWNDMFGVWLGDTAYALQPNDSIMIICNQAPGTWQPETNQIS